MLAIRVARLRELAGIANRELDRLAGVTPGHSWLIENNRKQNPKLNTLEAFANATGCTVGWLANGEGKAPTKRQVALAIQRARAALEAHDAAE